MSTNLVPALVTWHMALALGLLTLLHYVVSFESRVSGFEEPNSQYPATNTLRWLGWGFTGLVFLQSILGTQVREEIDVVASRLNYSNRDLWIERLGPEFSYHRALSTLLLLAGVWVGYRAWVVGGAELRAAGWMGALLLLNPLVGLALATFAVPAWLQPVHLVVGTGLFGASVVLALAASPRPAGGGEAVADSQPAASQVAKVS